jgi:hypothetical protein
MSRKLAIILLAISSATFGQTEEQTDSLISVMCKSLQNNKRLTDSTRMILVYGQHLFPFVERYIESDREKITEKIFYRFQRNCGDFADLLNRLNPAGDDWDYWEKTETKPRSKLIKSSCKDFVNHQYMYADQKRDTVHMVIEKGYWIDHYRDGTYSKLKFRWIDDCEFEIEFIESTNPVQNQFSKKGDRYRYLVIDKKEKYYLVSVASWNRWISFNLLILLNAHRPTTAMR